MLQLNKALVRPHLRVLYGGLASTLNMGDIEKLEKVQRRATRMMGGGIT